MPSLAALGWVSRRWRGAAGAAAPAVEARPDRAPAGAETAVHRAMRLWPRKFVADETAGAFDALCDDLGVEIYDPDWRAELHRCQLEVQGLDRPEILRLVEAPAVEPDALDAVDVESPAKPFRPRLDPERAAHAFVEWVRNEARCGAYSSKQITALYQEHCRAEDFIAVADNMLKKHLVRVPGVYKEQDDTLASAAEGHRRHRAYRWTINSDSLPDNVVDMIFPALPDRRAA